MDPALRCVKWTTVASACSFEPTLLSSTCSTTAMPAVLSATGCLRKALSRRTGRPSLREFVGALTSARTILDHPETDTGNFQGVAIYREGQELVVVSELEAGYYRYISQWRLHDDGTIRPRFGFSAVQNSCTCNIHHHHVYWRLDFDIGTAENNVNNVVSEFNSPPIAPPSNWHTNSFEVMRPRNPTSSRKWKIENSTTGDAYELIPGPDDGVAHNAAMFGRGDVWILRQHDSEIDDGISAAPSQDGLSQPNAPADIGRFINGESTV